MTYIVYDANHEQVNTIVIDPANVESWQELTGLTLELPPVTESTGEPNKLETYEAALTELGVDLSET